MEFEYFRKNEKIQKRDSRFLQKLKNSQQKIIQRHTGSQTIDYYSKMNQLI